jgi:hypothetical protein
VEVVHISVQVVALIILVILSIFSLIGLVFSSAVVYPDSTGVESTSGKKALLRAKFSFIAACSVPLIALGIGVFVTNPADRYEIFWFWGKHPGFLVLLLTLSSGMFVAASFLAFLSNGGGRWVLLIGGPSLAALLLLGAILIGLSI